MNRKTDIACTIFGVLGIVLLLVTKVLYREGIISWAVGLLITVVILMMACIILKELGNNGN